MSSPIKPVIFFHIPKTAGTTVHHIMGNVYRFEKNFVSYNYNQTEDFKNLSAEERKKITVLKGHFSFGVHALHPGGPTYFTFLRDPVSRCISEYRHILWDPYFKELASHKYTLKQMLQGGHHKNLDNCQVRFLAGANTLDYGKVNEETLELALKNFETYFKVFGIAERFDESILHVSEMLHWPTPYYANANVAPDKKPEFDKETYRLLEEHNKYDILLYKYASEKFDRLIKDKGESFQKKVARFRKLNKLQAPLRLMVRKTWVKLQELSRN